MDLPEKDSRVFGLIGYPLSHSFSQKYFRDKFETEQIKGVDYLNFQLLHIEELQRVIENNPLLNGFNVTIPYKEKILKFLNEIDTDAEQIGAVNTVKFIHTSKGKILKGYNTDFYGFHTSLKKIMNGDEKKALVLGYGGAAKAVIYALKKMDIEVYIASRNNLSITGSLIYEQINQKFLNEIDIIVNTTPLGMWPNVDKYPEINYHWIHINTIAYDLIYNPEKTMFLKLCENNGAIIKNGYEMLILQAEKAWEIFNS
jgi:shikimate dehydrogenase